jgi:hypothetical protein
MNSDVHEGKNGWLFLTGALATLYGRNSSSLPDAKLRQWVSLIETRAARLEQMVI